MSEIKKVIYIINAVLRFVVMILGFYVVLSTGSDKLFNEPLYAMTVLIFYYLILSDRNES